MELLTHLRNRASDHWLIGHDSCQFAQLTEHLYLELTQSHHTPPKVLLAERDPVRFLAGFMAACAAGCPVFLSNPSWVKQEWQQVFRLVQPDLILGHGDWESSITDYYPSLQPKIPSPPWIMIPTGGSSGQIRFAIHTWQTLMASVQGFKQYFQLQQINSFCTLPLHHVSGLMQFLRSFTTGGQLAILTLKELATAQPTSDSLSVAPLPGQSITAVDPSKFFISLVPTQLQRLLQPDTATWLSRFQTVLVGGAPAWPGLLEQARSHNIPLALTYGMTETASQIVTLKPEAFRRGAVSCGQVLPHARLTIHSPTGQQLAANEIGTITIQAKSLALGYYPDIFPNRNNFQLDDLGFFDDQGDLHIVGRSSNKIITGGENVFPAEVEAAIRATQLVNDVCVIGIPDSQWGQAVTAIYVPSTPPHPTPQTALKNKLSKFKQPKHWIPVQSLPRNPQGKVNHEQLLQIATATLQPNP